MGWEVSGDDLKKSVKIVEEKYDADIYIFSAPIQNFGFGKLVEAISTRGKIRPNGLLILTTSGGSANSAYQIARLMQQTYPNGFILFTPSFCKSAGTLIALGANRLIMDVFSELGPLDVQLLDRDEIGARKSGLLTRSAFEALSQEAFDLFSLTMLRIKASSRNTISFKLAADISWRLTAEVMSPIFSQMSPDVIGSDFRDLRVATEYGNRLASASGNPLGDTVERLVSDYPAHDFIIDRDEASSLFKKVDPPCKELYGLIQLISTVTHRQASPGIVIACSSEEPSDDEKKGAEANAADSNDDPVGTDVANSGDSDRKSDSTTRRKRERASKASDRRRNADPSPPDSGESGGNE